MLKHKDLLGTGTCYQWEWSNKSSQIYRQWSNISCFCCSVRVLFTSQSAGRVTQRWAHLCSSQIFPNNACNEGKCFCASWFWRTVVKKDAFNLLLTGGDASSKEIAPADDNDDSVEKADLEQEIGLIGQRKRPGRTPLYIKFPLIIHCATKFIKEHSFSPHVRRRETTGTRRWVTLKDILLENVSGLRESGGISYDTIHIMTVASRKNHTKAKRYKGLIDARVPGKRNQYRKENVN